MARHKPLGEIMVDMGLTSEDIIIECLNKQTEIHSEGSEHLPLGKLLVRAGYITSEQLQAALEEQARRKLPS